MKTKLAGIRIKAGPEDGMQEGEFEAYASIFDNVDSYGDVVRKGAFAETLKQWKASGSPIPILYGHDMTDPFSNLGGADPELALEDDRGLRVHGFLDLENPKAKQVYRLMKGRRIGDLSFAYDEVDAGPITDAKLGEVRELRALKLYEVSIVPVGANQETEILYVKANARALADGVKAGRVISSKNETDLRETRDALDRVLSTLESTLEDVTKSVAKPDAVNSEIRKDNEEEPNHGTVELILKTRLLEGRL